MKTCRVGPSRRQIIRSPNGDSNCIISYFDRDTIDICAQRVEKFAEICVIFELLDCIYCLIRELRKSSVTEMSDMLTRSKISKGMSYKLRPVHKLLEDNFNIVYRTGNCFIIDLKRVYRTEQVAWMGILGVDGANSYAIHNKYVNSSLFTSLEE